MLTIYEYAKCDSCRKAKKYLEAQDIPYKAIDITQRPPSMTQLKKVYKFVDQKISKLLNTSGKAYRESNMKEIVKKESPEHVLSVLSRDGWLIKRPIVTDGTSCTIGFNEDEFQNTWR